MAETPVAFVTTANRGIGLGHLRRCLTLSDALRGKAARTSFLVYKGDPAIAEWVRGHCDDYTIDPGLTLQSAVHAASLSSRCIVLDSYDVGASELEPLLRQGCRTMAIDDLADRALPATWILNTCFPADSNRYRGLTDAELLLGPEYALLRPSFASAVCRQIQQRAQKVLVVIGGTDPLRQTGRVVRLLSGLGGPLELTIVLGPLAHFEGVSSHYPHPVRILSNVEQMDALMRESDMAITGAGQTLFELAATGCPAIALQVADNQAWSSALFRSLGSIEAFDARTASDAELTASFIALQNDAGRRLTMSEAGRRAVDGRGAPRVADKLLAA
jgi:UDP-2,4-diacetamido-2,4,6-trideoxy-beta-L-altropyranose hydrolase